MSANAGEIPEGFSVTRETMHRIAAHVMGRRRFEVSGRFGLRASPGGFATPAYGEGPEALRLAGGVLICETAEGAASVQVAGTTLRDLALFAGTDLGSEFSAGSDTPSIGDTWQVLELELESALYLAAWYDLAWKSLDRVTAALPPDASAAVVQLWPEHFDVGTNVALPSGGRVNLGASPGDGYCEEPYLYVGPWGDERPGEARFWNAPFGAALTLSALARSSPARSALGPGTGDMDAAIQFFNEGLGNTASIERN
jgi:hypothetical protein